MLNKEELKYKEFLKLQKKIDKLWEKLKAMPNVKLKEPYQRGWIIKYDVRDDIKNRADYPAIKELLEKGWHDTETNNVNVIRAIRRGDTQVRIKNRWGQLDSITNYYPRRADISEAEYLQECAISKTANKYYILDTLSEKYRKHGYKRYYLSFPNYWLVLKVRPNIITHTKLKGGALQKEHDFLCDRVYYSGEFSSFLTNYGSSYPAHKDRGRTRTKISKFVHGKEEDIFNEKVPREYDH
jgi:hypothetical protein